MEGQSGENVETEVQKYMEALKDNIGKRVKIEYVEYGVPQKEEGTLRNVEKYEWVEIEKVRIPFVGYGVAIQKILGESNEVLYENSFISNSYDFRRDVSINLLRALSFGHKIENKLKEKRNIASLELLENLLI